MHGVQKVSGSCGRFAGASGHGGGAADVDHPVRPAAEQLRAAAAALQPVEVYKFGSLDNDSSFLCVFLMTDVAFSR